jgi:hypothetical protein
LNFYSLPGSQVYGQINVSIQDTNRITSIAWVKPYYTPVERFAIIQGGAYYFSLASDNSLQCYCYGRVPAGYLSSGSSTVSLNTWNFVANSWDSSSVKSFVDGDIKLNIANSGSGNAIGNFQFGAQGESRQFRGEIDNVRIYNRALSSDEIVEIYNKEKNRYQ